MTRAIPTLPQHATDPRSREDRLARARDAYAYDFSYAGLCFVESLPFREEFPPRYLAQGAEVTVRLQANRAAAKVGSWLHRRGESIDDWATMFPLLPPPAAMAHWREDWCFAWQRLAGPTPIALASMTKLPEAIAITDAELARALGRERASVSEALASRVLFSVDYSLFAGAVTGVTDGHAKFLWAPIVLFAVDAGFPGKLRPVAIQTAGHGGGRRSLYFPWEPDWILARTAANVADENLQGVLVHLGYCHMVIERFILATHRCLSEDHPLFAILTPHFETTLAVNQVAKKSVVNPGGVQDRLLAPRIDVQTAILDRGVAALDLASLDPTIELARRGVDDAGTLPLYPFRDDGLPIWEAVRRFVEAYVRLYYTSDADVAADLELAAFVREVGAADGGRLPVMVAGVSPRTVRDVIDLVARVVYRASAYHAAINDANYDWAAFVPSMPTAAFAELPERGTGEAALPGLLPSSEIGWETITATYQVANLHVTRLGVYGDFADARVTPIVQAFQADLARVEADGPTRAQGRPMPYLFLVPSKVTASINA
ncbi:MAG: lipoxygenase family protein [Sandaracinus sp.]